MTGNGLHVLYQHVDGAELVTAWDRNGTTIAAIRHSRYCQWHIYRHGGPTDGHLPAEHGWPAAVAVVGGWAGLA